jgi:O-antigen/teichoic acid export membrane protein
MARGGTHSILSNAAYLTASSTLTRLLRVVYLVVIVRLMGPELYGLLSYGQSWYLSFLALTTFGFPIVLPRELGRDRTRSGALIATSYRLQLLVIVAVTTACIATGVLIAENPQERNLLLVFALVLPGRAMAHWAEHVFTGFERADYGLRLEALCRLLEVSSGIAVAVLLRDVLALAVVQVLNWTLQGYLGRRIVRGLSADSTTQPTIADSVALARQALPAAVYTACIMWILQGPIVLFRQIYSTGSELGQLALLLNVFGIVAIVPNMLAYAALPVLSRSVSREDDNALRFLRVVCRAAFFFGTPAMLLGIAFGPGIVRLVFGDRYALAGTLLGYTLALLIPLTIARAAAGVLWARHDNAFAVTSALLGAVTVTAALPALANGMGPAGAILACASGISVWALLGIGYFGRTGDISLHDAILKPTAAGLLALAAYASLTAFGSLVAFSCAMPVFVGVSLALGTLTLSDLRALRQLPGKCRSDPA